MKSKIFIFAVIFVLLLTAFTPNAVAATHDVTEANQLKAFLEFESAVSGVKNGEQINPTGYDPNDPNTWTGVDWDMLGTGKVTSISWNELSLAGSLDVSGFTELFAIDCWKNSITGINTTGCTKLFNLICYSNQITSLDLSTNTSLGQLIFDKNQLTSLDVSANPALTYLNCSFNPITSLDISSNLNLKILYCIDNQLTSLDVSNNTELWVLFCSENQLKTIDISANTKLEEFGCSDNLLTALDVSMCPNLEMLHCYDNKLSTLDVTNNLLLKKLMCQDNNFNTLDVSNNSTLEWLGCEGNNLSTLDVSSNSSLEILLCSNNNLTSLDLTTNPLLTLISTKENPLTQIDAVISGKNISLRAAGNGHVDLHVNLMFKSEITATAHPEPLYIFEDWTQAGTAVSTDADYALTVGQSYDLDANYILELVLDADPSNGKIYENGRINIVPNTQGGTWDYDTEYLSADFSGSGAKFTGLKNGTTKITYTVGSQSKYIDVLIEESNMPATGQDYTLAFVLTGLAFASLTAGIVIRRKKKV